MKLRDKLPDQDTISSWMSRLQSRVRSHSAEFQKYAKNSWTRTVVRLQESPWILSRSSIVSGILVSILTTLFVFVLFTSQISPLTQSELTIHSTYTTEDDDYSVIIGNTGDFDVGDINITLTSRSTDFDDQIRNIRLLEVGQSERIEFNLNPPDERETYASTLSNYRLIDEQSAQQLCNGLSETSVETLPSDNEIIQVEKIQTTRVVSGADYYQLRLEYEGQTGPIVRDGFVYPEEPFTNERSTTIPQSITVTATEDSCLFNGVPLTELEGNGIYTESETID